MLFSHQAVATELDANFECAWESVRPVPKVLIDFGDGRELRRTLHGNVAAWICTPDGRAVDVIPGLITPESLLDRLAASSTLLAAATSGDEAALRSIYVERMSQQVLMPSIRGTGFWAADPGKSAVEQPVKVGTARPTATHDLTVPLAFTGSSSKIGVEAPIERMLSVPQPLVAPPDPTTLIQDSAYHRAVRDPAVFRMLWAQPLPRVGREFSERLFREVLQVDLADPYLGLAPYVLGGETGRN